MEELQVIQNKIYEIRGYKVMLDLIWLSFMELKQPN